MKNSVLKTIEDDAYNVIQQLSMINSSKTLLKLLQTCIDNKIDFFGIDDYGLSSDIQGIEINDSEELRINVMVKNIVSEVIPKFKNHSGVILCHGGMLHVKRLAADLHNNLKNSSYGIHIVPIYLHSLYIKNDIENLIQLIENCSTKNDNFQTKKYYKNLNVQKIFLEENPETGEFHSQELDELKNEIINKIKTKQYFIPNLNEENIQIIKNLGGQIKDCNHIIINSDLLRGEIKTKLGLNRCKFILKNNIIAKNNFLQFHNSIVVESFKEISSTKAEIVATFPIEIKESLTKINTNWEEVKLAYQQSIHDQSNIFLSI